MWICRFFGHKFKTLSNTLLVSGTHLYCPRCGKIIGITNNIKVSVSKKGLENLRKHINQSGKE